MKISRQLFFAVILTAVIGVLTYTAVTKYVVHKTEKNLQSIILSHRSFHAYIQQVIHPAYYKAKAEGKITQDFYAPELLSSSYIIRVMHVLFNQERAKEGLPLVYYKMASYNPRNPVNIADERETYLIKLFNEKRNLKKHTEVKTINGKKYLLYAKPFLETNQACLRCHGKRSYAPTGLQQIYSGQGGFNESAGAIRAIESIRIPLDDEFSAAFVATAASLSAALVLTVLYVFNLRLRQRVAQKTAALEQEIEERKQMEEALRHSEEKFRRIIESSPLAMYFYSLDKNDDLILIGANPAADRIIGIHHSELIGKTIEEAFPNLVGTDVPAIYHKVAKGELGEQSFEIAYDEERFSGRYDRC